MYADRRSGAFSSSRAARHKSRARVTQPARASWKDKGEKGEEVKENKAHYSRLHRAVNDTHRPSAEG